MSCPTKLIYGAAMKTPIVEAPRKSVTYQPAEEGSLSGRCWLCGCETETGHPKKKIIKPTFTDHDLAAIPWSEVVCEHCTWALSYRELRNYSILATGDGLYHPTRAQIREVILSPPDPPFLLCVAESGQRWLHFKSCVNLTNKGFAVRMDNFDVIVGSELFKRALEPVEEIYQTFTKAEIKSGNYQSHRIREFGMERWEQLERVLAPTRKSSLFQLVLFVAQREKK